MRRGNKTREISPVKAGGNVDLDEPRLQSRIQEDVKSKEFITGVPATPVKINLFSLKGPLCAVLIQ